MGIPGWLIHGRLDVSSPLDAPWRIHQAWPGSELIVVDDEGHGGDAMVAHWRRVLADAGEQLTPPGRGYPAFCHNPMTLPSVSLK